MDLIDISPVQLLLCLIFVFIAGTGSAVFRLRLERDLAWGTVRTFAQLYLVGYVLKYIFQGLPPAPGTGLRASPWTALPSSQGGLKTGCARPG